MLRAHRRRLLADQAPGVTEGWEGREGWMFPSRAGTPRTPNSMDAAWTRARQLAGITQRFTLHGLRYTFTDLVRRANVDAVVRRALTGHVTEEMQRHYSTVGLDEKRAAVAGVIRLLPPVAGGAVDAAAAEAISGQAGGPVEGSTSGATALVGPGEAPVRPAPATSSETPPSGGGTGGGREGPIV